MLKKTKGFTLLEVLIAGVILFVSIAAISLIYKSSYTASLKAYSSVEESSIISGLLKKIQMDLRAKDSKGHYTDTLTGDGIYWGIEYSWTATLVSFRPPMDKFNSDMGKIESYSNKFKLWTVSLTIGSKAKLAEYYELSWL